jgi:invasion protein IalB
MSTNKFKLTETRAQRLTDALKKGTSATLQASKAMTSVNGIPIHIAQIQ